MKRIPLFLFLALLISGCGFGPSQFVSEEYDLKITFPCSYKEVGKKFYGCEKEGSYIYSVNFLENDETSFADEEKERFKRRSEENKDSKIKKQMTEKKVSGYDAVEYTTVNDEFDG